MRVLIHALDEKTKLNLVMSASNILATITLINCESTVPRISPNTNEIIPISIVSKNSIIDIFLLLIINYLLYDFVLESSSAFTLVTCSLKHMFIVYCHG